MEINGKSESDDFIERIFNSFWKPGTGIDINNGPPRPRHEGPARSNPCVDIKARESRTGREINLEKKIKEKEDALKYLNEEFKASVHAWKGMLNEQKKETAKVKGQLRKVESVWQTRMKNMEDNAIKRIDVLNRDKERLYRELEYASAEMLVDKLKGESKVAEDEINRLRTIIDEQKELLFWHIGQREEYLRKNEAINIRADKWKERYKKVVEVEWNHDEVGTITLGGIRVKI